MLVDSRDTSSGDDCHRIREEHDELHCQTANASTVHRREVGAVVLANAR